MTIATSFEKVTNNSPDGAQRGKGTGEKVAFYGNTPVVQPTSANQGTVTETAATLTESSTQSSPNVTIVSTVNTLTTGNGSGMSATNEGEINALFVLCDDNFADLAEMMNKLTTDITASNVLNNQLRSELVTLGLIKGS